MKKCLLLAPLLFLFLVVQISAQNQIQLEKRKVNDPELPRVSAYEAYVKYKAGKAIILYAGGEDYRKRHIIGAFNLDVEDKIRDKILPKFPKEGIEIFLYCY